MVEPRVCLVTVKLNAPRVQTVGCERNARRQIKGHMNVNSDVVRCSLAHSSDVNNSTDYLSDPERLLPNRAWYLRQPAHFIEQRDLEGKLDPAELRRDTDVDQKRKASSHVHGRLEANDSDPLAKDVCAPACICGCEVGDSQVDDRLVCDSAHWPTRTEETVAVGKAKPADLGSANDRSQLNMLAPCSAMGAPSDSCSEIATDGSSRRKGKPSRTSSRRPPKSESAAV